MVVAFLLGPYLVELGGLPFLISVEAAMGLVILIPIMLYYPNQPKETSEGNGEENLHKALLPNLGDKELRSRTIARDVWLVVSDYSCLTLLTIGGLQAGIFAGWQGLLQQILDKKTVQFSEKTIG